MTVTFLGTDPGSGISGSKNSDNTTREYRARFRLRSTLPPSVGVFSDVYSVLRANGCYLGAFSAIDGGCWVKSISPQTLPAKTMRTDAGIFRRWDFAVDVVYSTNAANKPDDQDDPTLRPPIVSYSSYKYTSPATETLLEPPLADGSYNVDKVNNSAGDPITRERKRGALVVKITKVFSQFDPDLVKEAPQGYLYSRNLFAWNPIPVAYMGALGGSLSLFGVLEGNARIEDLTVAPLWNNGLTYAKVDAEIHIDTEAWVDEVLDQGYTYLGPDGTRSRFVVPGGFATTPQNLDGAGHPIAANAKPVSRKFQYYPAKDWSILNLP